MGDVVKAFAFDETFDQMGACERAGIVTWKRSLGSAWQPTSSGGSRPLSPTAPTRYVAAMSDSDKPLRQQIDDGMAAIRRQLERLHEGPTMGGPSDDRSVIADLKAEYQALKEARVGVGPHDRATGEFDGETHDELRPTPRPNNFESAQR